MSAVYELIGRLVVEFIRRRYRREIRAAAAVGLGVAVIGVGAYLASRENGHEESA
jgi:hypothetical protein